LLTVYICIFLEEILTAKTTAGLGASFGGTQIAIERFVGLSPKLVTGANAAKQLVERLATAMVNPKVFRNHIFKAIKLSLAT
jgi:hypothetical protein